MREVRQSKRRSVNFLRFLTDTESTPTQFKRQNIRLAQVVSLIFTACALLLVPPPIVTAQTVHIPDPNLRTLLELTLGKQAGTDITQADMASLQSLQNGCHFLTLSEKGVWWVRERWICESTDDTVGYGIQDLTGLEFATNLTDLSLGRNQISDVSPLKDSINLTHLDLGRNQISDVSLLKDLINLTDLTLGRNQISDVSPLRNLINLTHLSLINNRVSDVSALKNLTNLIELDLLDNQISDISAFTNLTNLTHLSLRSNEISDISPLENLTNLTYISLRDNKISDVSPLENLINLIYVHLGLNDKLSDISPLENLTNLIHLDFDDNEIADVSPLENLTNLKHLDASSNEISDISPIKNLTKLTWLDLDSNESVDISLLKDLSNLRYLDLHHSKLSDLTPLIHLTKLTKLILNHNAISDVSPLKDLTNLKTLNLSNNQISDVSPLKDLANLKTLNLSNNQISDFTPIAGLTGNLVKYNTRNQRVPSLNVDVNRDSVVDVVDLILVALNYRNPDFANSTSADIYPDVNSDGVVNIKDLLAVAAEVDATAAAPTLRKNPREIPNLTAENLKQWIQLAKQLGTQEPRMQKGITVLEQLLAVLTSTEVLPQETALLANYPNPFNPETWMPYQLAEPATVNISIYAADGKLIRTLALGQLAAGVYHSKSRAAYWDGRNALGESVASGVYFYTLTAGDFTATRKMLIQK